MATLSDYEVTINGDKADVVSVDISYTSPSYTTPNYGNYTTKTADYVGSASGTARFTAIWPPEYVAPVYLDCEVCGDSTEYEKGLALCPACIEAVREMRDQYLIGQIAEMME